MRPTAFALTALTPAEEARISALVNRAFYSHLLGARQGIRPRASAASGASFWIRTGPLAGVLLINRGPLALPVPGSGMCGRRRCPVIFGETGPNGLGR